MNYEETIEFLFSQLPAYQRIGKAAYKADLKTTLEISEILDHPERDFKSVHIAGTNGKGSVSHMLASVFQAAGYKTGLYTSPHLKDFRERIKVNGEMISREEVLEFVRSYQERFSEIKPSFFEWTVGLAFHHFRKEKVDIAIVEVGMGGRLDSTNIILPELSVITNIGLDHTQFLGDTIEKIAGEKAGIIKEGIPVVFGEKQSGATEVIREKAREKGTEIFFAEEGLDPGEYETDLKGHYQKRNLKTSLRAVEVLRKGGWDISEGVLREGLKKVVENTGLLGRWQELGKEPLIIADTGHNREGLTYTVEQLRSYPFQKLHIVFGVVGDKSPDAVLEILPGEAEYYFCRASIPRAMDANELYERAQQFGLKGKAYSGVSEAFEQSKTSAGKKDLIFIGGSTFVVAEVL